MLRTVWSAERQLATTLAKRNVVQLHSLESPQPTRIRKRVLSFKTCTTNKCSTNNATTTPPYARAISSTSSLYKSAQAMINPMRSMKGSKSILPLDIVLDPRTKALLPVIGHASYMALASGFLMTDMLGLRVLLVSGYTGLVAFHTLHERPLRIPLRWSAVFVAVNAVAAGMLIMDRYAPYSLNTLEHPDGEELYQEHFADMLTRGQFHELLSLSRRDHLPAGRLLTRENVPCGSMYFIISGQAQLFHGKTKYDKRKTQVVDNSLKPMNGARPNMNMATIEQGGFVNDVSFQRGIDVGAYGTVVTAEDCDILVWDTTVLRQHLKSRPDLERNMKFCMSDHLVKSLMRQREAAHLRQEQHHDER